MRDHPDICPLESAFVSHSVRVELSADLQIPSFRLDRFLHCADIALRDRSLDKHCLDLSINNKCYKVLHISCSSFCLRADPLQSSDFETVSPSEIIEGIMRRDK